MEDILLGVTDRTIPVFIADPASTDGSGKTGLVAANLTVSYTRVETDNDVVVTDVTSSLSDLSALTDAHADWGLKEVSSTLAPGLYRLDVADAVFASGAWYAVVYVMITSSAAAATPKAFRLVAFNALDGVRLGLTALPNAAADAAGGLPISDAGGLDLDAKLANTNEVTAARMGALTDWINGGRLDSILDIIAADTTTDIPAVLATLALASTALSNVQWTNARAGYLDNINNATLAAAVFPTDPADQSLVIAATDAIIAAVAALNNLSQANVRTAVGLASANLDTQLGDLPTNAELATSQAAADDATLAAIAALNNLSAAQVNTEADAALVDAGVTTTVMARLDVAISTRLATAGYTAPLDAAGVRTAVGLGAANLDAQLLAIDDLLDTEITALIASVGAGLNALAVAIKAKTDLIPAAPAAVGDAMTLTAAAVDAVLDEVVDGAGTTLRQALRGFIAALLGKASGLPAAPKFRDRADTKNVIDAVTDADGNRSSVTLILT